MRNASRPLAYGAVSAALGVVLLYAASLLPTGKIAAVIAASLAAAFLRLRFDGRWALGCFAVTGLLGLLALPTKAPAILYLGFFGYYPILKMRVERLSAPVWRWVVKLLCFNLVMAALYLAFRSVFPEDLGPLASWPALMLLASNAAFIVYDCALSQGILYYLRHISGRME